MQFNQFKSVDEFLKIATENGVVVSREDVDQSAAGDLFVDDMNAEEWLEIMTQD
jgi:hypothetical protein